MQTLTIAFDLDGTLVETAPDLIRATNHALGIAGVAPVAGQLIRPSISFGARAMIVEALRIARSPLSDAEIDKLHAHFLDYYATNIATGSHAYPGLVTALDALSGRGTKLVVCTNKQEHLSRQLLDALGLTRHFRAIAGRDTLPVFKPDPGHLTGAIRMAGGDPGNAVMVGDSGTDIKTARAAGIPVIGVPFGYTDVPIRDLDPDIVIEHYDELLPAVEQLTSR